MIKGSIDNFSSERDVFHLGGWAFGGTGADRVPVDRIEVDSLPSSTVRFHTRGDFPGNPNGFGFLIRIEGEENLLSIVSGAARVHACWGEERLEIRLWKPTQDKIVLRLLEPRVVDLADDQKRTLVANIAKTFRSAGAFEHPEIQDVLMEVGSSPLDMSVVLGRKGYLFLAGGSNDVDRLYKAAVSPALFDGWCKLIRRRSEKVMELGGRFVQVIVPEKQSVLRDLHPGALSGPTPLAGRIAEEMASKEFFLDAQSLLQALYVEEGLIPYRRVDSHLSFHGAKCLAEKICCRLTGTTPSLSPPRLETRVLRGDLGNKFGRGQMVEIELVPPSLGWDFAEMRPKTIASHDPPGGVHTNIRRVWHNDTPLVNALVVVFGNSMFERGTSIFGLSWWFQRIFRSTTFVWNAAVDFDLLEKERPDFVVGQTVERFLNGLPPT